MAAKHLVARCMLALACLGAIPAMALAATPGQPLVHTLWVNPFANVKVAIGDCSGKLCGWVVWASPEAEKDAREGGVAHLVGTQVLQNYRPVSSAQWQGRVFVPDLSRSFTSTITRIDAGTLKISGCILGGLICKSQLWHRA